MTFFKKLAANRNNAAKSTLEHGITAHTITLSTEDGDAFLEHLNTYIRDFHPATQAEMDIVATMSAAVWRLRRAWRIETALLDAQMAADKPTLDQTYTGKVDPTMRSALAFKTLSGSSASWHNLDRYQAQLRRTFRSALTDLMRLRQQNSLTPVDEELPEFLQKLQNEPKKPFVINIGE